MAFVKSIPDGVFTIILNAGWIARVDGIVAVNGNYGTMIMTRYGGVIQKSSAYEDGNWSAWTNI